MRDFIYTPSVPYLIKDARGQLEIHKGDVVTTQYKEERFYHCTTSFGRSVCIPEEDLKKFFKRTFDYDQEKYFNELRDKAAVAAMNGFLISGIVDKGSSEESIKYLVSGCVKVATALVEELKATV